MPMSSLHSGQQLLTYELFNLQSALPFNSSKNSKNNLSYWPISFDDLLLLFTCQNILKFIPFLGNNNSISTLYDKVKFSNRTSDRPPLNLKVISGELDLPQKTPKVPSKGTNSQNTREIFTFPCSRHNQARLAPEVPRASSLSDCSVPRFGLGPRILGGEEDGGKEQGRQHQRHLQTGI